MASGSFAVASSNKYVSCTCLWESTKNVNGNYSTVKYEIRASRTNSGYTTYGSGSGKVTINGKDINFTITSSQKITQNSNTLLASGSVVVYHEADGSKTITISVYASISGAGLTLGTTSKNVTLDTIPRASSFDTITGDTIGSNMTVNITRNSSSFTHQLLYQVGNSEWYDLGKGIETSKTFAIDMENCWATINATSVVMKILLRTFNGTTQVGNDITKDVVVYVPESIVPTVSFTVEESEGYLARFGSYVQGKTKLEVNIQANGAYGSTIKTYETSFDGKIYTQQSFETDAIALSGNLPLIVTVTDSRGRSGTIFQTLRVMSYEPPRINSLIIKRTDANGTDNSNGDYLTAVFDAQVTRLDENVLVGYRQNEAVYKAKYVSKNNSADTKEEIFLFDQYEVIGGVYTFHANRSSSYVFTLYVDDFFTQQSNNATLKTVIGGTASKLFSVLKKGLGFAFNKVAELEGFLEINFKTFFYKFIVLKNMVAIMMENAEGQYRDVMHMTATNNLKIGYDSYDKSEGSTDICGKDINFMSRNGIWINGQLFADFVIEQGTSGIWTYRKWNSGIAECWAYSQITFDTSTSSSGISGFNMISAEVPLPFDFLAYPSSTCNCAWSFTEWVECHCNEHRVLVRQICNTNSMKVNPKYVSIQVIGRWK